MGTGCETDAWLLDPSVLGRWEHTPVELPVLNRIASIEDPEDVFTEYSEPTAEDLIPEIDEYRVGPGDQLALVIWDIPIADQPTPYDVIVSARGAIRIPQLGEIFVSGKTADEVREAIVKAMAPLVDDALASVEVATPRQDSFTVVGAVGGPGQYFLPEADYRLMDALAAAGWFAESADHIYVIRQIPLTGEAAGEPNIPSDEEPDRGAESPTGENLIDIIDDLSSPGGAPGVMGSRRAGGTTRAQPELLDLIEDQPEAPAPERTQPEQTGETSWMYLNGEWVRVARRGRPAPKDDDILGGVRGAQSDAEMEDLVTQRVIRLSKQDLLNGRSTQNIVIRPGDVIRVPSPPQGFFYLGGQVNRGGSYGLVEGITLERAIASAGGLTTIAIPERVDLTRMVGDNRQATIRLNLRAIAERTQPDIYLKDNDYINIGTNFWAFPAAVIRNGFRFTYGFGFLVDRNFGNDIFGAPPTNVVGG